MTNSFPKTITVVWSIGRDLSSVPHSDLIPPSEKFIAKGMFIDNQLRTPIKNLGWKNFGAQKLKSGFTWQKTRIEIRRTLMCCENQSDNLSIYYKVLFNNSQLS